MHIEKKRQAKEQQVNKVYTGTVEQDVQREKIPEYVYGRAYEMRMVIIGSKFALFPRSKPK